MQLIAPQSEYGSATTDALVDSAASARILVVDDQLINRHMLCQLLQDHGVTTIDAASGQEALELLESERIDLVLLDIVMPEMDGFEVLNSIRLRSNALDLPVIMLTSSADSRNIVRAFQSGANDYVTKPIDVAVTMARISTHLKLRQAQAALRESEERYALVARGTNDGLWDWDLKTDHVYYSPRLLSMLGLSASDARTTVDTWQRMIHEDDQHNVREEFNGYLQGFTTQLETEFRMRLPDDRFRWMLCRGLAVRDESGRPYRMAGSLTDITEGKVADGLTGLPNRVLFDERLRRCADRSANDRRYQFALIYLDVDNFKLINDSMGHIHGDQLLRSIARRLEGCVRAADSFVARLGGDEFAILVERIGTEEDARRMARRILDSLSAPFALQSGREVFASVSVGISVSEDGGANFAEMLQEADIAMYQAKAMGKSCCQVFNPQMKERVTRRLEIENELRHAVEGDQFQLMYQPIVALRTGELAGFEALIRWNSPSLGQVSPGEFIPIAEDTGLIVVIGRWVLQEACRQMAQWKAADPRFAAVKLSVNLSSRQLVHDDLLKEIFAALESTGMRAEELVLEITESTIMQSVEAGETLVCELRESGVKIAIDDFGTGYSSLSCLHRLPFDILKIDRSFIEKITLSDDNNAIVGTIVSLANRLGLDVVAEGIETVEHRDTLAAMSCEFAQGYLYSRPLCPEGIPAMNWDIYERKPRHENQPRE